MSKDFSLQHFHDIENNLWFACFKHLS